MEFKKEGPIHIFNLFGFILSINPEEYFIEDSPVEKLHIIEGEFYYCDLLVDGKMIVPESFINKIIEKYSISFNIVKGNTIYTKIEFEELAKLRKEKFKARFLFSERFFSDNLKDIEIDEEIDEEDEDIEVFIMI